MTLPDLGPLWLTLQLAGITTVLLILIGTPLAWWLAQTQSRAKPVIEALTALPLVLPPTVLGAVGYGAYWILEAVAGIVGTAWKHLRSEPSPPEGRPEPMSYSEF